MGDWEYHQDTRDKYAALGIFGAVAVILVIVCFVAAAIAQSLAP